MFGRLNSYNLQHEDYQYEVNVINNFLQNNSFPIKPHILKPGKPKDPKMPKKWATFTYTGCPRRNVPDFGRVFLMLNYTDITQNT